MSVSHKRFAKLSFKAKISGGLGNILSTWSKLMETTCPSGQINSDKPKSEIRRVRTTQASEPAQIQGMSTAIHQPAMSLSTVQSCRKMELLPHIRPVKYPPSQ